jgi:dynein heavy chain, axonemal
MIKYIISEVLYGGRVTDEIDRRLLNVYSNQFFNEKVIGEEKYILADSNLPYFIPDDSGNKDKQSMEKNNQPGWYEVKIREFP